MEDEWGSVREGRVDCFICKNVEQIEENRAWYCSDPGHVHWEIGETCSDCGRILCEATEDLQLNMSEHQTRPFPHENNDRVLRALEKILPRSCSFDLVRIKRKTICGDFIGYGDKSYFSIEFHQTLVKSALKQ